MIGLETRPDFINRIANSDGVREYIRPDGRTMDWTPVAERSPAITRTVILSNGEDALAAFELTAPGIYQSHTLFSETAEKMKRLGMETGADLRDKPLAFLQQNFGSSADWYYAIARGIDERPVNPNRERKSSGSETTFDRDLFDDAEIEAGVLRQADDVWDWCEKTQEFGRTVTVKIKYGDFQIITRSRSHPTVIDTHDGLRAASQALIRSVLPTAKGIRLVGVTVSNFDRAVPTDDALPLFETSATV